MTDIISLLNEPGLTIGALIGIGLSILVGFVQDCLTRQAEKERQIRELAVNAAIEQWKTERARAGATGDKVKSLRLQIARFLKFSEILSKKNVTAKTIAEHFIESNDVVSGAEAKMDESKK